MHFAHTFQCFLQVFFTNFATPFDALLLYIETQCSEFTEARETLLKTECIAFQCRL